MIEHRQEQEQGEHMRILFAFARRPSRLEDGKVRTTLPRRTLGLPAAARLRESGKKSTIFRGKTQSPLGDGRARH